MSRFTAWIALLILIGSVWSQQLHAEGELDLSVPRFGFGFLDTIRKSFCNSMCTAADRTPYFANVVCAVKCPELYLPHGMTPATTTQLPVEHPITIVVPINTMTTPPPPPLQIPAPTNPPTPPPVPAPTNPPMSNPPPTNPPAVPAPMNPPMSNPPPTNPPAVPAPTNPPMSNPPPTNPSPTMPNATMPNATMPNATMPNATMPNATMPNATMAMP